jgi:predicted PurR-regulated permease PerM
VTSSAAPQSPVGRPDLVKSALTIIGVLVVLRVLWETRFIVLITILGCLLGIAAAPGVDWLEKRRIKRGIGAAIVVLGTIALVAMVGVWSAPTVLSQIGELRTQIPASIDKLDAYMEREHGALLNAVLPPRAPSDTVIRTDSVVGLVRADSIGQSGASGRLGKAIIGQAAMLRGLFFTTVTSTLTVLAGFVYVVFLTMYLAIEPHTYRRGILFMVPPSRRDRGALLFDAVTVTLRKWLNTQLVAMLVIGIVTTIVLLILGVKSAIPLGILAGILEFVPNLGPLMAAIPAVLIAFPDGPQKALMVIIAYWAIQFLENNVLIPHLMREELDLPPALTLLWQALMAIIFGLLGLFVAVPLLAALFVSVRFLYVRGDVPPVRRPRGSRQFKAIADDSAPA